MKAYHIAIDSLYILSIATLSLGIPEQCAYEYNLEELLQNECENEDCGFSREAESVWAKSLSCTEESDNTWFNVMIGNVNLFGTNRIHGPPSYYIN